jgi:peptide/nickel transport system permease protein
MILRRFGLAALQGIALTIVVVAGVHGLVGDPVVSDLEGAAARAAFERRLRLDLPTVSIQGPSRVSRALVGDFGPSIRDGRPALGLVAPRVAVSASIGVLALLCAAATAVPAALAAALRPGGRVDRWGRRFAALAHASPTLVLAPLLLDAFAGGQPFRWFPAGGLPDGGEASFTAWFVALAAHLTLPVSVWALHLGAVLFRYGRVGFAAVASSDLVLAQRGRRVSEAEIALDTVFPRGAGPLLATLGGLLPGLVGGAVVLEVVFGIPGSGTALMSALAERDLAVVSALLVALTWATVLSVAACDVAAAALGGRDG